MSDRITAKVQGVPYASFAKIQWRRFIPLLLSVPAVALICFAAFSRNGIQWQSVLVLAAFAAIAAYVYRGTLRTAYRASGLQNVQVTYTFTPEGWEARGEAGGASVSWKETHRVRKSSDALVLFPNRKSVNIIPAACFQGAEVERVLAWARANKA